MSPFKLLLRAAHRSGGSLAAGSSDWQSLISSRAARIDLRKALWRAQRSEGWLNPERPRGSNRTREERQAFRDNLLAWLNERASALVGGNSSRSQEAAPETRPPQEARPPGRLAAAPAASVGTDKDDYAPGETVTITAEGFGVGATVRFSIADDPGDSGDDADVDDYGSFWVSDGQAGDLDGELNGRIVASWTVPSDDDGSGSGVPDALNATLQLTAEGVVAGPDGIFGSSDDGVTGLSATATFTDSTTIVAASSTVYDETAGLQNEASGVADPDNNNNPSQLDDDIALSSLPAAFSSLIQGLRPFNTNPAAGYVTGAALSGYGGSGSGAQAVVISSTASVNNLAFSSGLGGSLLPLYSNVPSAGVVSGLATADGEAVSLFRAASDDNIALGYDSSGQLVLALYLEQNTATNPAGAKIWMVAYEAMAHLPSVSGDDGLTVANLFVSAFTATNFDLGTLASGQNRWNVFGDSANQVIVIADEAWSKGQTINTSQGGGGNHHCQYQSIARRPRSRQGR